MASLWRQELEKRGIELVEGVIKPQAIELFQGFDRAKRPVYNTRQG